MIGQHRTDAIRRLLERLLNTEERRRAYLGLPLTTIEPTRNIILSHYRASMDTLAVRIAAGDDPLEVTADLLLTLSKGLGQAAATMSDHLNRCVCPKVLPLPPDSKS